MRILPVLLFSLLVLGAVGVKAGSVLLPEDNSAGNSSLLGLTPKASAPTIEKNKEPAAPPAASTTAPEASPASPTTQAPASPPPSAPTATNAPTFTPGGSVAKGLTDDQKAIAKSLADTVKPQKRGISKEEAQVRAAIQEAAKAYELPPIFLDEPDDMDMAGSFSKLCQDAAAAKEPVPDICNQLRTLLTVSVASGYMWGAQDVAAIKAVLGYGSQEIPGKCQLRLEPMGLDIGGSVFAGQRRDFRSSHDVKSLSFRAKAVCNPPSGALPKSGGVITRLRGKYAVALPRDVTCAVQRGTLEVQYGGDGAAKCN